MPTRRRRKFLGVISRVGVSAFCDICIVQTSTDLYESFLLSACSELPSLAVVPIFLLSRRAVAGFPSLAMHLGLAGLC